VRFGHLWLRRWLWRDSGCSVNDRARPHVPDVLAHDGDVYAVTPKRFREHLDAIAAATGAPPSGVDGLASGAGGWAITFDDGGVSALHAGEELARRSWQGHFFIVSDYVGQPGYLDWDGIRALKAIGHVIGSHSCSYPDRMADLSWEQLLGEWSHSAAVLAERLGAPVSTASVPGGLYSDVVGRAAAKAGYATLFTSLPTKRVGSINRCTLIGRYAIRRHTSAAESAAAAAGQARAWTRQRMTWRLRGAAKKVAGPCYKRMRRPLLARR
jgi:peptidoglycan/xylan/chitin deacetylase (PgdA/CDA1 family)